MHNLIADFIFKMPEKIKDMKSRNEDSVRLAEEYALAAASSASGGLYPTATGLNPTTGSANQAHYSYYHHQSNLNAYYGGYYYPGGANVSIAGGSGIPGSAPNPASHGSNPALHRSISAQVMVAANENHDFEDLLNLIGDIYMKDPLKLELCLNYWIADSEMNQSMLACGVFQNKPTLKQTSLYKFVRYILSGDSLIGRLYIAYINMLTGLSTGEESSQHCFLLLQSNSHFYDSHTPKISWHHIFYAFERYHDIYRLDNGQQQQQSMMLNASASSSSFQQLQQSQVQSQQQQQVQQQQRIRGITQQELQGLCAVARLVNQIALHNEKARLALCEYQRTLSANGAAGTDAISLMNTINANGTFNSGSENSLPSLMFGLLTCPIPVALKGELFNVLASLSLNPLISVNMWQLLEISQIVPTSSLSSSTSLNPSLSTTFFGATGLGHPATSRNDIKSELEEVEAREESYPMLRGFLSLIRNLVTHSTPQVPDNLGVGVRPKSSPLGFQPYMNFLINHVYLKFLFRSYKTSHEKWQVCTDLLNIFYQFVNKYEIDPVDFQQASMGFDLNAFKPSSSSTSSSSISPGFRLINDLIHDGPIVKMLFTIINECLAHLLEYNASNDRAVESSSLMCLKLIDVVIRKQRAFVENMREANLNIENSGVEKIIVAINPKTNRADYLMSILRFIQFNSSLISHSHYSLSILFSLSSYSIINSQLLNLFLKSCLSLSEQFELMHSFVEFLEFDDEGELSAEQSQVATFKSNIADSIDYFGAFEVNGTANVTCAAIATTTNNKQYQQEKVDSQSRSQCRLQALRLLLFYLRMPAPNIAHLLLGFDINKSLRNQSFFNPGTKINYTTPTASRVAASSEPESEILTIVPRNCLHSVVRMLNRFVRDPVALVRSIPATVELCYEILFTLCSNPNFNQQLLAYLRQFDFVSANVRLIPLDVEMISNLSSLLASNSDEEPKIEPYNTILQDGTNYGDLEEILAHRRAVEKQSSPQQILSAPLSSCTLHSIYSWILGLTCLEMQSLIVNRQKTALKSLVQLLITENLASNSAPSAIPQHLSKAHYSSSFDNLLFMNRGASGSSGAKSLFQDEHKIDSKSGLETQVDSNNKIFALLTFLSFSQPQPSALNLNYFDLQLIEKVIETCRVSTNTLESGQQTTANTQIYDIKKLRTILVYEIKQSVLNISQANLFDELKNILQYVLERNLFQLGFASKKKYIDSFKLLVESFMILMPCEVFPLTQRYTFLVALIKKVFDTLTEDNLIVELTYPVSNLLFTLVTNLRQVIMQLRKQHTINESNISSLLLQHQQPASFMSSLNFSNLSDIFKKIIDYLLNTSLSPNFKVRTHLYATILNYLMIFDQDNDSETYEWNKLQAQNKLNSINAEIVENFRILSNNLNGLLKIICSDSCEGFNITTMMGLSLLTKIIELDGANNHKWIKHLNETGYIKCLVNSIANSDNKLLEESFGTPAKNEKAIYLFESKLALFTAIAGSQFGADCLLKSGLITTFSTSSVFNIRARFDRNIYGTRNVSYLVQMLNQFYQIFVPVLNLLITIVNTMGYNNIEAKSQVAKFILGHNEVFLHVLSNKISNLKMLNELRLITSLLSKLAPFDLLKIENTSSGDYNSSFSRIHKELLNLLSIFFSVDQLKQMRKEFEQHHTEETSSSNASRVGLVKLFNSYAGEIASSLSSYCTSIMKVGQFNQPLLIFVPKIESSQLHPYSPNMMRLSSKHLQLGLLIDFVKLTIDNLEKASELLADLNNKNDNINDLIEIERKQLVSEFKLYEMMSENEKQLFLKQQLGYHIKTAKQNKSVYTAIIEKCLLILWRHIEFYLNNFDLSNNDGVQLYKNDLYSGNNSIDAESFRRLDNKIKRGDSNKEEFAKFRQDLISILNPMFFKRCSDLEQKIDSNRKDNFIGILSKRIQRLVHLTTSEAI